MCSSSKMKRRERMWIKPFTWIKSAPTQSCRATSVNLEWLFIARSPKSHFDLDMQVSPSDTWKQSSDRRESSFGKFAERFYFLQLILCLGHAVCVSQLFLFPWKKQYMSPNRQFSLSSPALLCWAQERGVSLGSVSDVLHGHGGGSGSTCVPCVLSLLSRFSSVRSWLHRCQWTLLVAWKLRMRFPNVLKVHHCINGKLCKSSVFTGEMVQINATSMCHCAISGMCSHLTRKWKSKREEFRTGTSS